MEHAIWKGKMISASEIAEDFKVEKSIRVASRNNELLCPDPECQQPVLKYCHGDIKDPFFSHRNHGSCDYAAFDKETTPVVREIQRRLLQHFQKAGYQTQMEVKILPHHYTHLVITFESGDKIAIEIGTQRTTLWQVEKLTDKYAQAQIPVTWIVIGDPQEHIEETHACFIKRHQLNESGTGDLFVISADTNEICQCRLDPNHYCFEGQEIASPNYPRVYQRIAPLSGLTVKDGRLEINGFAAVYENWLVRKQKSFQVKVSEIEENIENRKKMEQQLKEEWEKEDQNRSYPANRPGSLVRQTTLHSSSRDDYEARKKSILSRMDQVEEQVWDSADQRWIRCKICGKIDVSGEFSRYGGPHEETLGICRDCYIQSQKSRKE